MARGIRVVLGLGLAGLLLVLASGPLREPHSGRGGDRAYTRPDNRDAAVPKAVAGGEAGRQGPPAILSRLGGDPQNSGQTPGGTVKEAEGRSPRLSAQIASLVRHQNLARLIEKYALQYGVDQDLVWAVIRQESGFNPQALSPRGAMGLMQLMPGTAALMGVADAFDVEQNIAGGIKYLERCLSQFNQDVGLALAAYNAGPDNVVKYQGCPPFPETRQYVARVLAAYGGESMQADLKLLGVSPLMAAEVPDPMRPAGLAWRVPRPQFHIGTPQVKLGPPRWKPTLPPF
jgi:hypothetical protein